MFLRSQGIGPAGTLVAKGVIDERSPILIADFHSDDEPGLARMVTEAFKVDFSQTRIVRPVEASRVAQALQRMELDPAQDLTEQLARQVARRDGIPAVVSGTVGRVGGGYVLTARIVAAGDGTVLASERETASDSTKILGAIDALSGGLRTRIGESFSGVRADAPLESVTTASLPALELYSRAIQVIEYEADPEAGVRLLKQALEEDPSFASAWRKLGAVLGNMGGSAAEREGALTKAYELRERLTPRERYLAEAAYARDVQGDRQRAIAAYERMLDMDPDDDWALNNVAILHGEEGDDQRSLELMERSVALDTSSISLGNLAWHRVAVGDLEGADSAVALLTRKFPEDRRVIDGPAVLALHREDFVGAERHLRAALAETEGVNQLTAIGALASVVRAQGRLAEAEAIRQRGARAAAALGFPGTFYGPLFERFWADFWIRGDTVAARRSLAELESERHFETLDELDRPYSGLANANAWMVDAGDTRRFMDRFRQSRPDAGPLRFREDEVGLRATVALAEGRYDEAIEAYHELRRLAGAGCQCALFPLGLAHERAGRPDSAIAYYEQAIDVHGPERLFNRSWDLGPALERIALLHDGQGHLDEAAAYYSRLADLWADADEDLQPRVAAARARAEEIVRARG
jgi:tetratricopeptide (TPR) repeat protein